jgi:hypothetical protein
VSVTWTIPAALIGLALVALPIAVHLLARQPVRTLAYPSLRFLLETQLAALRRRRIRDVMLLLCRVAIVAAAAAALAGPVFESDARMAAQAGRVSRAIVIVEPAPADVVSRLGDGAVAVATFQRQAIADALADAVRWLNEQPRSAREIVIAGSLRRGAVSSGELAMVEEDIGLRFEQTATPGSEVVAASSLERRDGVLSRVERSITLTSETTGSVETASTPVAEDLVTIRSRPRDTVLAGAALRAALNAGVPWRDFDRPVVIVWEGGDTATSGDALVVRMSVPAQPAAAADAVRDALMQAGAPDLIEPEIVAKGELDTWSRVPGPPFSDAPIVDEGDRRWLWALALMLLGVEWWMRRRAAHEATTIDQQAEARVA